MNRRASARRGRAVRRPSRRRPSRSRRDAAGSAKPLHPAAKPPAESRARCRAAGVQRRRAARNSSVQRRAPALDRSAQPWRRSYPACAASFPDLPAIAGIEAAHRPRSVSTNMSAPTCCDRACPPARRAAGVFTTNRRRSAPTDWCKQALAARAARRARLSGQCRLRRTPSPAPPAIEACKRALTEAGAAKLARRTARNAGRFDGRDRRRAATTLKDHAGAAGHEARAASIGRRPPRRS